ncbi:tellurite resistance TerB family protein [Thalassospira sp.]|uniref:tellurite resistance TerB family protein n=1 Tax=Thalassospira sp. TaxID=1912094 RepID=UPI0027324F92|nr:tellurite resistance TerB family protein [Thalassospira sp.]MDP2698737.1 tellurite resistance TerB family protein [Thalassospira sp.]
MISHQDALIYTMVIVSAADNDITDAELAAMGRRVRYLPVFAGFDSDRVTMIARDCAKLLGNEDGLDTVLDQIRDALPKKLRETAYVFACEIVLSDGEISQEELRILELIRHHLDIDRLAGAAIERAMAARYVRTGDF